MEILFFRIGKRIAGVATRYLEEVIHAPKMFPFLPVSRHIPNMVVRRGNAVGVITLQHLFSLNHDMKKSSVILLKSEGITFGLKVIKILQVRTISRSKLVHPHGKTFIPDEFLECACKVRTVFLPIISPDKILHHPDIRPLWYFEASDKPVIDNKTVFQNS